MNEISRRPFLTRDDEELILPTSLPVLLERREEFVAVSGLAEGYVVVDPLISIPLPIYLDESGQTVSRWPGAASFMWNPLAFLPEALSHPDQITTPAGMRVWAVVLIGALARSGLYDVATGWADVATSNGLDLSNPVVLARLDGWCHGHPDEQIDAIATDVGERLMAAANPIASATLLDWLPAQHALFARQMVQIAESLPEPGPVLELLVSVSYMLLGDAVVGDELTAGDALVVLREEAAADPSPEAFEDLISILNLIAGPVGATSTETP